MKSSRNSSRTSAALVPRPAYARCAFPGRQHGHRGDCRSYLRAVERTGSAGQAAQFRRERSTTRRHGLRQCFEAGARRDADNRVRPAAYLPLAVKIINRNLDRAVARTLSFSGDRVEELMLRLRTHLKRQGKELVLLVEEFARLQGIDRALLQAITSHGDDRQCKMRSAIAVTTGFFESVAETAYMRTTHIVDMDRSAGRAEGQNVTTASLSQFASRYLNAVRLGRSEIDRWNESAGPSEDPPSRCATCSYQGECHAIFGAVDGYGLYPFTSRALWNSASRADTSMPGEPKSAHLAERSPCGSARQLRRDRSRQAHSRLSNCWRSWAA